MRSHHSILACFKWYLTTLPKNLGVPSARPLGPAWLLRGKRGWVLGAGPSGCRWLRRSPLKLQLETIECRTCRGPCSKALEIRLQGAWMKTLSRSCSALRLSCAALGWAAEAGIHSVRTSPFVRSARRITLEYSLSTEKSQNPGRDGHLFPRVLSLCKNGSLS